MLHLMRDLPYGIRAHGLPEGGVTQVKATCGDIVRWLAVGIERLVIEDTPNSPVWVGGDRKWQSGLGVGVKGRVYISKEECT